MSEQSGQKKLSSLAIAVVVCGVVLVVAGGGYLYWHAHKAAPKAAAVDPYAGWTSYCDTQTHGCFKHPAAWEVKPLRGSGSTNAKSAVSVTSPDQKVAATYVSPWNSVKPSGPAGYFIADVAALPNPLNRLSLVGGMPLDTNAPVYSLVDSSLLQTYPLKANSIAQLSLDSGFANPGSTVRSNLTVTNPYLGAAPQPDRAKAWFSSNDGKTARMIIQSFYYR